MKNSEIPSNMENPLERIAEFEKNTLEDDDEEKEEECDEEWGLKEEDYDY